MATNDLGRIQPIPQGNWDMLTAYEILDIVNHNDSSWISTGDSVNSPPADGNTDWQLLGRQTSSAGGGTRADQEVAFSGTVSGTGSVGSRTVYELNFTGGPTTDFSAGTTSSNDTFTMPVRQNFVAATVDAFTGPPTIEVSGLSDDVNGTYEPVTPTAPIVMQGLFTTAILDNIDRLVIATTLRPFRTGRPVYNSSRDYLINYGFVFGDDQLISPSYNEGVIFVRQGDTENHQYLISLPGTRTFNTLLTDQSYSPVYRFANADVPPGSWVFTRMSDLTLAQIQCNQLDVQFAFNTTIANVAPPFPQYYPHPTDPAFQRDVSVNIPNLAPRYMIAIQDSRSTGTLEVGTYDYVDGHTESQDREALLNFIIDHANNTLNITPQWSLTFDAAGDSVINTNQTDVDRFSLDLSTSIFPNGNGSGYMPTINGAAGGVNMADMLDITYRGIVTEQDTISQLSDVPIDASFIAHNVAAINAVGQNYSAEAIDNNSLRITSTLDEAATMEFQYRGNNRLTISSTQTQTGGTSTVSGTAGLLTIDGDNVPLANGDSSDIVAQRSSRAVDNPLWTGSVRGNTKAVFTSVDTGPRTELPVVYSGTGLTFTTTFTNGT